jgi:integral membrane protein (TIGR01906 family)
MLNAIKCLLYSCLVFIASLFMAIYFQIPTNIIYLSYWGRSVLNFIFLPDAKLNHSYFNTSEISHLQDVKNIFDLLAVFLLILSLTLVFILLHKRNQFQQTIISASKFTYIVITLLVMIVIFDFRNAFINLHFLIFPNGNWSFDPQVSNLINQFPEQFFMNFTLYYVIIVLLINTALYFFARKCCRTNLTEKKY